MSCPIIYLTVDQIKELHAEALTLGGVDGLRSEHLLASAVFQPQQSAFGEDAHPTIPEKAAAYGFFIAENQPFLDGNKRTGELALATFLDLNGYELIEEEDAIAQMFLDLGAGVIGQEELFAWVCNRAKPSGEQSNVIPIRKDGQSPVRGEPLLFFSIARSD